MCTVDCSDGVSSTNSRRRVEYGDEERRQPTNREFLKPELNERHVHNSPVLQEIHVLEIVSFKDNT